jgi:GNAT superfamily N-acetyltransferase
VALRYQHDCLNIDWSVIPLILETVGMGFHTPEIHRIAFTNSHTVVFVFDEDRLIGFGRALSDGVTQAALYDVAVLPEYQGKGIGKSIVKCIIERLTNCNFILYASPGKEGFYEPLHFRRMKTGMALFRKAEYMQQRGFTE